MSEQYGQCKTFGKSVWRTIGKYFSKLNPRKGWVLAGFSASQSILTNWKNMGLI